MAKRKRLSPARPGYLAPAENGEPRAVPGPLSPAPIAQVAGEAANTSALVKLAGVLERARSDGLMLELVPLTQIDDSYLVRDRMVQDEDEMQSLMTSMRARGQQTPIELIELPEPDSFLKYGLISGWRRLTALKRIHDETGDDRFSHVRALIVAPETAQAAYVAMVEENEIRADLSHYERARIALRAVHEGVYPTLRTALQGLYGATTRSKRSKIGSFVTVVEQLDTVLAHPTAIPEKLGLALSRELSRDPGFAERLIVRLRADRRETAAEEMRILSDAVAEARAPAPASEPVSGPDTGPAAPRPRVTALDGDPRGRDDRDHAAAPGVTLRYSRRAQRIELTGPRVDDALHAALKDWLATR